MSIFEESTQLSGNSTVIPGGVVTTTGTTTGPFQIQPTTTDKITIGGTPNSAAGQYTIYPYSGTTTTILQPDTKYSVMDLPRDDSPISVFVDGAMVTLGILGTSVECAYTGGQLVFEPGIIRNGGVYLGGKKRVTISVEYHDEIYHFNVDNSDGSIFKEGSSKLKCYLVSTISKER